MINILKINNLDKLREAFAANSSDSWNDSFNELEKFINENKRLPEEKEESWLYDWLSTNIQNSEVINSSKILKIKELIGFAVFKKIKENTEEEKTNSESLKVNLQKKINRDSKSSTDKNKSPRNYLAWEYYFNLLKYFVKKNKRYPSQTKKEEIKIYQWLLKNRKNFTHEESLEISQFLPTKSPKINKNLEKWNDNFKKLKEFITNNKRYPKKTENPEIYNWFAYQVKLYENLRLPEERVKILEQLIELEDSFNKK